MRSSPSPTARPAAAEARFAATRRALGDAAFQKLAAQEKDSGTPLPDILRRDPLWQAARKSMPWLADVAQMEHHAHESLRTPPAPPLDTAGLEAAARDPLQLMLYLQPHVRLLRSGWDIPALWQALAAAPPADGAVGQEHLGAAVAQESFTVIYNDAGNAAVWRLDAAAYTLLEHLDAAPSFAPAAAAALRIDAAFALDRFLALLVQQRLLREG